MTGRVAIVTGAGGGIGRAICLRLARAGARLVVSDIDLIRAEGVGRQVGELGASALTLRTDVTDAAQVAHMVAATVEAYGTVDFLVNNAGHGRPIPSVLDISEAEWDRSIALNLKSVFLCSRAVLPVLLPRRSGRIVNIASLAGRTASTIAGADYTAAKSGVVGLTRHLAREVASSGITVNAVCPGPADTRMVRDALSPEQIRAVERRIPVGRLAEPGEIAGVVAFLLSDEGGYVTGASIDVNGGLLMI